MGSRVATTRTPTSRTGNKPAFRSASRSPDLARERVERHRVRRCRAPQVEGAAPQWRNHKRDRGSDKRLHTPGGERSLARIRPGLHPPLANGTDMRVDDLA